MTYDFDQLRIEPNSFDPGEGFVLVEEWTLLDAWSLRGDFQRKVWLNDAELTILTFSDGVVHAHRHDSPESYEFGKECAAIFYGS